MLTHKGTQTIITQRLTLRRFQVDDAQAMFDTWANDERVTRFLTWVPHESPELTKQLLESWCALPEAAKAVIDFLFAEVGFNRVGISHAVKNPASGRVAQKCGLTFEGTKWEYFKASNGEFLDISDYGIIRREWEALYNK